MLKHNQNFCTSLSVITGVLLLCATWGLGAEPLQSVEIQLTNSVYSSPLSEWYWAAIGNARIDLRAPRNEVVRAHLQVKPIISNATLPVTNLLCSGPATGALCLDVPYANIRARFLIEDYAVRLNVGRAALTWGDGTLYNAANTIFGATSTNANLTQSTVREESTWLVSGYFPLGQFGFIEPVLLPPVTALTNAPLEHLAAGLRIQAKIAQVKSEASYLFFAKDARHTAAVSFQGNLGIDWYLSSSLSVNHTDPTHQIAETLWHSWRLSLGLFHIVEFDDDISLSLRLESLWHPAGTWSEVTTAPKYALWLYPELVLSLASSFQIYLRSIVSVIDLSALVTTGVVWQPSTGLSLALFPSIQLGEPNDRYHLDRPGGITVSATVSYLF